MKRRIFVLAACFAVALGAPAGAHAFGEGTPDESPPAEETICEDAGLLGAAFGLCVAFCEANDCDAFPDSEACEVLRRNYAKITGEMSFPCEDGGGGGGPGES